MLVTEKTPSENVSVADFLLDVTSMDCGTFPIVKRVVEHNDNG